MHWTLGVAKTLLATTLLSVCLAAQLTAQPLSKSAANIDVLQECLAKGRSFEEARNWQEAIQHYESAHRKLPHEDVKYRWDICRIHYDVVRRYGDPSFTSAVEQMNAATALDLYSEVLGKLELNYVEPVRLEELLKKGTAYLEVSLTEPDFLSRHLPSCPAEQIENFRLNVHKMVLGRTIRNRMEARNLVNTVAMQASKTLGLSTTATVYEYIAGAVGLLDPYSGYMTAGELNEQMSAITGNLIGIGVELKADKNDLRILDVFEGSPAAMAGLMPGDQILQVGDAVTAEVSAKKAADLLRGPVNSQVRLVLSRSDERPMEVVVTRRRVEVPSVVGVEMVDTTDNIGYLRITNFQSTTTAEVDQALWRMHRQGMKSLVMDLRKNPGGLLDAAVEVADRFIRQGAIVTTRGRNGNENRNYLAKEPQTWDLPLVVLIDKDSASASEIFAGAIRDHHRGMLVGSTSYGKGSVQGLFRTDTAAGGLRLTVSKFFSPLGHPISYHGVEPDIKVESEGIQHVVGKPVKGSDGSYLVGTSTADKDPVLRRGIQEARAAIKISQR